MAERHTKDTLTPSGKKLMLQLAAMRTKPLVKVGILARDFDLVKESEHKGFKPTTLGIVAASNEFGTDTIPSRPFIGSTVDAKALGEWRRYADELRKEIVQGKLTTDQALMRMGERIKKDIQEKIRSDIPPPNAPATIAAKDGKDKTLIATGQMLNAIAYELLRESTRR